MFRHHLSQLLVSIVFLFLLSSCYTYQKFYVRHLSPVADANNFIDSLQTNGVDSIFALTHACWGCVDGPEIEGYVFWIHHNSSFLKKFSPYAEYDYKKFNATTSYAYAAELIDTLKTENIDREYAIFDHFAYYNIFIRSASDSINFRMTADAINRNQASYSTYVINKFQSMMLHSQYIFYPGYNYQYQRKWIKKQ